MTLYLGDGVPMKKIRRTIICPLQKSVCGNTNECNGSVGPVKVFADDPCPDCPIEWEKLPTVIYCNKGMVSRDFTREQCLECRDNRIECEFAGMY